MEEKLVNILEKVQTSSSNHQKSIKLLENLYNSVTLEQFIEKFLKILYTVLQGESKVSYVKLTLEFLAKFCAHISKVQNGEIENLEEDAPTHPFLSGIISDVINVIKYHKNSVQQVKYNACSFVSLVLQNIDGNTLLDDNICDQIQMCMLENIEDPSHHIRYQAVLALVRLQDPINPECPVIKAYLSSLKDTSPLVRKEVVIKIAPNALTVSKIKDRTADIDPSVRSAAYSHCADIGIKHFKIVHRHFILMSGFNENNPHCKKIFLEYLLSKWLTSLNGDYLAFLKAIKLDADEVDILNTEVLSKQVLEVFFRTEPINNLIEALPLDEGKLIPINTITTELAYFWNVLSSHLRKSDELDDYLDRIIPELTAFSQYIDRLVDAKLPKIMEEWEYLDFQNTLFYLFDIAEKFDLAEESGRRTLDALVKKVLRYQKLQERLTNKLINIGSQLSTNKDSFTTEMILIINDIREPLIEVEQTNHHKKREKEFRLAEFTIKVNILEGDLEDAIGAQNFKEAQELKIQIEEVRKQMDSLNAESQTEKVRVSKNDPETLCWCLDLLYATLSQSSLQSLSPALITCRQEFLLPLLKNERPEVSWRALKCLASYCIFDKKFAEEHAKLFILPIASYRIIPNFNKSELMVSVSAISDLLRIYGTQMFETDVDQSESTTSHSTTRRRLYTEDMEDVNVLSNQMTLDIIINIILDLLDDDNDDIRDAALEAIAKLILNGFSINSMIMTRIILKWYSPATETNFQQKIGIVIHQYIERIKDAKEIVSECLIPVLSKITNAPKTSPLLEVDPENAVKFIAALTDSRSINNSDNIHRDLAHTALHKISSNPADISAPYLAKFLTYLNICPDNLAPTKELITQAELLLESEMLSKASKQHIAKFIFRLKGNTTINTTTETTMNMTENISTSEDLNGSSTSVTSTDTSRKSTNNRNDQNGVPRRLSSIREHEEEHEEIGETTELPKEDNNIPNKKRKVDGKDEGKISDSSKPVKDAKENGPKALSRNNKEISVVLSPLNAEGQTSDSNTGLRATLRERRSLSKNINSDKIAESNNSLQVSNENSFSANKKSSNSSNPEEQNHDLSANPKISSRKSKRNQTTKTSCTGDKVNVEERTSGSSTDLRAVLRERRILPKNRITDKVAGNSNISQLSNENNFSANKKRSNSNNPEDQNHELNANLKAYSRKSKRNQKNKTDGVGDDLKSSYTAPKETKKNKEDNRINNSEEILNSSMDSRASKTGLGMDVKRRKVDDHSNKRKNKNKLIQFKERMKSQANQTYSSDSTDNPRSLRSKEPIKETNFRKSKRIRKIIVVI